MNVTRLWVVEMAKRKQHKRSKFGRVVSGIGRGVFVLMLAGLVMVILGILELQTAYGLAKENLGFVAVSIDEVPPGSQATSVYARDYDNTSGEGSLLAKLFLENRSIVTFDELPAKLIACLLSTEDHRFFEHNGVDVIGTGRAVLTGIKRGGDIKGTSTITQQLARNVFLPYIKSEKTLNRKIQEAIYAFALEENLTKEQILENYLNYIYLGAGAHGVKAAASTYFAKDLDELTLAECAMLAGLPQTPSKHNPYSDLAKATARRNTVLGLLKSRLDEDFFDKLAEHDPEKFGNLGLTAAKIDNAIADGIILQEKKEPSYMKAPYFTSYVREHMLYPRYGQDQILRDGMVVVTTLDLQFQEWAEQILAEGIDEEREKKNVSQGALVLIENSTGNILACVGGYKWGSAGKNGEPDKYNRAMQDGRPVGSAFKPFNYATAYEQGFGPGLLIWDGPNAELSEKLRTEWPKNSDRTYRGWISMFYALQWSRNAASVDLIVNVVGPEAVVDTARKMGIDSKLEAVPALTLGVFNITPAKMAEAFSTFANMGLHKDYSLLKRVYTTDGALREDFAISLDSRTNRAFSENTAWTMIQNMIRVVEHGTGRNARVPGLEIGGKTGTNDDYADAWFVGYTPELSCAVWVGNDDYAVQMKRMHGGDLPAAIFSRLLKKIYSKQTELVGEGDAAVEVVIYEPRYTQKKFKKPPGATFNGFPGAQVGQKWERDEEGNWIIPGQESVEEEGEETSEDESGPSSSGNNGFYERWDPPPDNNVFF